MATNLIRKTLIPLAALSLLTAPADAATSWTLAAGYVQVTIPGNTLGAISATLLHKSEHTSNATVNNDWLPLNNNGTPNNTTDDVPARQTLTVTGAGWTAGQWTAVGHLAYVSDSDGGEEAFLVLSNTVDTITVATTFNLLDAARSIPATSSVSIRKAQTIGALFGTGANSSFTTTDRVYLWNGSGWTTYNIDANGNWKRVGNFFPVNNDIIFPDEGMFIQRNAANPITLTFFGDVPGKAQVTTMPGPGLLFVSSRYPVNTTISQLGFETLPNWQLGPNGDLVYVWNGSGWTTYYYSGGTTPGWRRVGNFFPVPNDPIAADSALFVSRKGTSGLAESANAHALPYLP